MRGDYTHSTQLTKHPVKVGQRFTKVITIHFTEWLRCIIEYNHFKEIRTLLSFYQYFLQ